jgi:hypothetical protein
LTNFVRIVGKSYKDSGRPAEPAIPGLLSKRRSGKLVSALSR